MPKETDNDKILIAKRRQKELSAEEIRRQSQEAILREIAERGEFVDSILKKYVPALTGDHPGSGGSIGKASHLASMQAEAVAAMMMTDLLISALQIIFNTPHLIHQRQFAELLKEQQESMNEGNPIQLVYMPDENGVWPTIYVLDKKGNPKFDENNNPVTYENGQAPVDAVRAQRFVPKPNVTEGYLAAIDQHMERMWGSGVLSEEQQLRLRNMRDIGASQQPSRDKVRDNAILRQMSTKPTPRPGKS